MACCPHVGRTIFHADGTRYRLLVCHFLPDYLYHYGFGERHDILYAMDTGHQPVCVTCLGCCGIAYLGSRIHQEMQGYGQEEKE